MVAALWLVSGVDMNREKSTIAQHGVCRGMHSTPKVMLPDVPTILAEKVLIPP